MDPPACSLCVRRRERERESVRFNGRDNEGPEGYSVGHGHCVEVNSPLHALYGNEDLTPSPVPSESHEAGRRLLCPWVRQSKQPY